MSGSLTRKHPRSIVEMPVAFTALGRDRVEATCHDLCLGGAFVVTDAAAPFGAEVTLHVHLPAMNDEVAIRAKVRWVKADGMGLQFSSLGIHETRAIMALIKSG